MPQFKDLTQAIESCNLCPRLRAHCVKIAKAKRRAYRDETYWGKPVSGFGDLKPKIWIVGLAPGAHGANRTGRVFTGDRSGEWLYGALFKAGFSSKPESAGREDGLKLKGVYVSCVARCAPPDNKPTPIEIESCRPYLEAELRLFTPHLKTILILGGIALDGLWPLLKSQFGITKKPKFGHGAEMTLSHSNGKKMRLLMSYHPSQQNTQTGRLTPKMWSGIFSSLNAGD